MIGRRAFLSIVGATAFTPRSNPGVQSVDWTLTCDGNVCAVTVHGLVNRDSSPRTVHARVRLSDGDTRTVTEVVQPNSRSYAISLIVMSCEFTEDTIEVMDVWVSGQ